LYLVSGPSGPLTPWAVEITTPAVYDNRKVISVPKTIIEWNSLPSNMYETSSTENFEFELNTGQAALLMSPGAKPKNTISNYTYIKIHDLRYVAMRNKNS